MNDRYLLEKHYIGNDKIRDWMCNYSLDLDEVVVLLNQFDKDKQFLEELKKEYRRIYLVLDDFMSMTDRLQAQVNDKFLQSHARDMLEMMGVEPTKCGDTITDLQTTIITKLKEENDNLKQALWEAEVNYYGERCDNPLDYESWIEDLKEEWDKEYWND